MSTKKLIPAIGRARTSEIKSIPAPQKWYSLHIATYVIVIILLSALIFLNLWPRKRLEARLSLPGMVSVELSYGIPFTYRWVHATYDSDGRVQSWLPYSFDWYELYKNVLLSGAAVIVIASIVEWLWRSIVSD